MKEEKMGRKKELLKEKKEMLKSEGKEEKEKKWID